MFSNELLIDLAVEEQELLSGGQFSPTSGSSGGESQKQDDPFTYIPLIVLLPVATVEAVANSQRFKK